MREIREALIDAHRAVGKTNPVAPSITNFVTVEFVANAQLAIGGSAAMVYLPDEGEAMCRLAKSIYINVGTLIPSHKETVPRTVKCARENAAYVLDPVAAGMGDLRTELLQYMKAYPPRIIRGNASEILTVAKLWGLIDGTSGKVRGVDATESVETARAAAEHLAAYIGGAVAVSGKEDLVTDGKRTVVSKGGSAYFTRITGSGCSLGGVAAVYLAVADPFVAALAATNAYNVAGKRAEAQARGTASFQVEFLDALSNLTAEDIAACEMEEV
ncbi:Hydroxyethylthiazole kinase [Aedoeadaptatus ivorii]|uniref:Hydroxyethylthiazole kinase n=1 Tax=Aedoeadaptatus ivorii TaxID=54006 RepID=A0A3S4YQ88_9FIRM|nr:hydroxyethylthiazole kinase [Peptoniphilus ivorii]MDQ0508731.1 hydroxyethylthiazole kinase [Peptoniphilus ivorii]VEJ36142.1 Hydroxyethylthiazole kinase [Peptoniphilus ivorii]